MILDCCPRLFWEMGSLVTSQADNSPLACYKGVACPVQGLNLAHRQPRMCALLGANTDIYIWLQVQAGLFSGMEANGQHSAGLITFQFCFSEFAAFS